MVSVEMLFSPFSSLRCFVGQTIEFLLLDRSGVAGVLLLPRLIWLIGFTVHFFRLSMAPEAILVFCLSSCELNRSLLSTPPVKVDVSLES